MKVMTVTWNENSDVTRLKFADEFKYSDWLIKLDVLQDLIGDLTEHYNSILEIRDWDERNLYAFDSLAELENTGKLENIALAIK